MAAMTDWGDVSDPRKNNLGGLVLTRSIAKLGKINFELSLKIMTRSTSSAVILTSSASKLKWSSGVLPTSITRIVPASGLAMFDVASGEMAPVDSGTMIGIIDDPLPEPESSTGVVPPFGVMLPSAPIYFSYKK